MITLKNLKKTGIYIIKRLGWGIDGFSELDLIEFKESFLSKVPDVIEYFPEEQFTIKDFLMKKSLPEGTDAKIFGGILDGY